MKKFKKIMLISFNILLLTNFIALYGKDPKAINRYGTQLGNNGDYNKAIEKFDESIKLYDKASAKAYHNRGWALELKGKHKKAIPNYEEALKRYPPQVITGEKLGFLYYKSGDYENAIRIGEHVLKYDPKNKEVPKWLPDAYIKKNQQDKKKRKKDKKKFEDDGEGIKFFQAEIDFTIRTAYTPSNANYGYQMDSGFLLDVPNRIFASITPTASKSFQLDVLLENPWLGVLMPSDLVMHNETAEAIFTIKKKVRLGFGVQFNHYDSNISFSEDLRLWDIKIGLLFGILGKKSEFMFRSYPRLLPFDGKSSKNQTLDVDYFKLDYKYILSEKFAFYFLFECREYYVIDHTNEIANYWGTYDFGLGFSIGFFGKKTQRKVVTLSIEFIERLYFNDMNNTDPYTIFNGQGWFGLNSGGILSGNASTGYNTNSHIASIKVEEQIIKYFKLYQKFIMEFPNKSNSNYEFNFQIGVGGSY